MTTGIVNTANITDNATLKLDGAAALATATVGGTSYLFAAGPVDDGVSVFAVGADGSLTNVANVGDDATLKLDNPLSVTTAEVGGTTYLFAAGFIDDGISVFAVGVGGSLTNVANVGDDATLKLNGIRSVATATVGGTSYLFAAGVLDNGVSVFAVGADGSLTNVANVGDSATLKINGAFSVTTAEVGGTPYLFVAGAGDNGVSVFAVGADGALANVANVGDNATLKLAGARSVATATVGGTTYLFVAGANDNGVSVFAVGADGSLTNVANVGDDATLELSGATSVATAVVGGTTYLFAAGVNDHGVSMFTVGAGGSLTNVANISDDVTLELDGAAAVTAADAGDTRFLFAAGAGDDGVSVFELAGLNLTGGPGDDTLDGTPFDDVIDGGAGDDTMVGGLGNDTYVVDSPGDTVTELPGQGTDEVQTALASYSIAALANVENLTGTSTTGQALTGNDLANVITGGAGDDTLDGGLGADTMAGGLGDDTFVVDSAGDAVVEAAGEGTDAVQTALASYSLASLADVENLTGTGTAGQALTGNGLANVITGGAGDDALDGGEGTDVAVFSGARTDYAVADLGDGRFRVADLRPGAPDGTDTLTGIETVQFSDGSFAIADLAAVAPTDLALSNAAVAENSAPGTVVGTLSATDPDPGDSFTFELVDNAGGRFALAGADLVVAGSLDFESTAAHQVTVRVTDAGGLAYEESFTVVVTDVAGLLLTGDGGDNVLSGSPEADILDGLAGADAMSGGLGNDFYFVDDAGDTVVEAANEGTDTVRTALDAYVLPDHVETLSGENDSGQALTGNALRNIIVGYVGDDSLDGGAGDDIMSGNVGDDSLDGGAGDDIMSGGGGDDSLDGGEGTDLAVFSGAHADYAVIDLGDSRFQVADLRPGAPDGIDTLAGIETVQFRDGSLAIADAVNAAANSAPSDLALSNAAVAENRAPGTVVGTLSATDPDGDSFTFELIDNAGGRFALAGADLVVAGSLDFESTAAHQVTVRVTDAGGLAYEESFTVAVTDVAGLSLTGDGGHDILGGSPENDILAGLAGDDHLDGAAGDDTLDGGAGDDQLFGGAGDDTMTGGPGDDTYVVDSLADTVVELAGEGFDLVNTDLASFSLAALPNVEGLEGDGQTQTLIGNDLANVITGSDGDDTLVGGAGDDELDGEDGADVAIYSGVRADYAVTLDDGDIRVADLRPGAPDGTDQLFDIERVQFSDGSFAVDDLIGPTVTDGLLNVDNVADDATLELDGVRSVAAATVGGTAYLFAAGRHDDGISVFAVGADGALANVANVGDDATLKLNGAFSVTTAMVGGTTYLFAASANDNGVSVFAVGAGGALTNVANVGDDATLMLDEVKSVTTAEVGGTTYLFAASDDDDGVSVFAVGAGGTLTNVANVGDDATLKLDGARSVATAMVGGTTYLFAAGRNDNGVSVFAVGADGALTNVANVGDDATLRLRSAASVATATVDGTTYLFAGGSENGISVFAVGADGALTSVADVDDDQSNLHSLATATVGGTTYLFAAVGGDGVNVLAVGAAGGLTFVTEIDDDGLLNLTGPGSVTVADSNGTSFLFAAGGDDDGVSVFELAGQTVTGGPGDETLAGTIFDDIIDGGAGDDELAGSAGDDELDGGAGTDVAIYSGARADYAVTDRGNGIFSVADRRPGAPDGTDTLEDVEILQFSDGSFAIDDLVNLNIAPTDLTLSDAAVAENSAPGTVVGTLAAVDPDPGETFAFALLDDAGGRFALDGTNLVVAGALDFEDTAAHQVTVRVTDAGGDSYDESFTVAVTDVAGSSLVGDGGSNTLIGSAEDDGLAGLAGDDTLRGGAGADRLDGGAGRDTADYSASTAVSVNLLAGTASGGEAQGDTFAGIENLRGGAQGDVLTGDDGGNGIDGAGGPNLLHGLGGDDFLTATGGLNVAFGDAGNDQLYFVGNQNQLFGSEGSDWLGVDGNNNALAGGAGDDVFIGASGNSNTLAGQDGSDALFSVGANILFGEAGNDWLGCSGNGNSLFGGDGADYLGATGNNNTLDGGTGNDTLEAAAGHASDRFVFHAGYGMDTVIGFSTAGGDTVDLETFGIADFAQLQAYLSQAGNDVVIALNGADVLTLRNVQLGTLTAGHFDLV